MVFSLLAFSCKDIPKQERKIPGPEKVAVEEPERDMDAVARELKGKGFKTFTYTEGDTTFLMQQYYIVFLKTGENRDQDSTQTAKLRKEHLNFLIRMAEEGYASLTGPIGDKREIRGIAVYNTATQRETDSLAKQDPMVKAGRLKVEVHPWWTAKGCKLN